MQNSVMLRIACAFFLDQSYVLETFVALVTRLCRVVYDTEQERR